MRMIAVIVWTALATAAVAAMFRISFEVEKLEARLQDINQEIAREQEAIHVLQAEWSYLNRPQRIEDLSRELLPDLKPIAPDQFVTFARLPKRDGMEEDGTGAVSLGPAAHMPGAHLIAGDKPQ